MQVVKYETLKKKPSHIFDGTNALTLSALPNILNNIEFYEKSPSKHMDTTERQAKF